MLVVWRRKLFFHGGSISGGSGGKRKEGGGRWEDGQTSARKVRIPPEAECCSSGK